MYLTVSQYINQIQLFLTVAINYGFGLFSIASAFSNYFLQVDHLADTR